MSGTLPETLRSSRETVGSFLQQFADRQMRLQIIRGIFNAFVCLFLCAIAIAMLDATHWLVDGWRWGLICVSYVFALFVGWTFGLKGLWYQPSQENIAWSLENAHPNFRESLLTTIDLRRDGGSQRRGSLEFIAAIEQGVAHELDTLNVESLLPWRKIAQSAAAAIAVAAVLVMASYVPNLRFSERLARAMIPFVSLVRPSNVQIDVLEPSPTSMSVPTDQSLRFVVEVTGGVPSEASLELVEDGAPSPDSNRTLKMMLESNNPVRFSLSAPISDKTTRYRVLAGDGQTLFRTLTPVPRPKSLAFHATVTPPAYTKQDSSLTSNVRGDLQLLSGSRVHLAIDTNLTLAKALILLEYTASGRKETLALSNVKPSESLPLGTGATARYAAEFDVTENARYQVRLVSNFEFDGINVENSFSPTYRIEAIEDAGALVAWAANEETYWKSPPSTGATFIVASNEILKLATNVSDNLPIEQISNEISINRGDWQTTKAKIELMVVDQTATIPTSDANPKPKQLVEANAVWAWDLLDSPTSSGDSVASRVTVVDRKGNVSHSPTVQFSIASASYDRNRHASLVRRAQLVAPIRAFAEHLSSKREQIRPLIDKLREANVPESQLNASLKEIRVMADEGIAKAQAIRSLAKEIMVDLTQCIDQNELELTVRTVSRMEREFLKYIQHFANVQELSTSQIASSESAPWHQSDRLRKVDRMLQAYDRTCEHSKRLLEIYCQFIGLELQAALTKDLTALLEHQKNSLNRATVSDFAILTRSNTISEQYMDSVVKLASDMESNVSPKVKEGLSNLYRWIDQTRLEIRDIAQADESAQSVNHLKNRIERSSNELKGMRWGFNLGENLIWVTIDSRKELLNQSGSLGTSFENLLQKLNQRLEATVDKSLATDELLSRVNKLDSETTGPLISALAQMLDRRDIHQLRTVADPLFPIDMGMAHRALTNHLERCLSEPTNAAEIIKDLKEIAKAYRILEAAHETVEARLAVQALRPREQYEWKTLDGQLVHPKQWDSVNFRIELAHQWMQQAGFPGPVIEKFNALRWCEAAQRISQKLNVRRDANNTNVFSASEDIREMLELWAVADSQAKPTIDAARAVLAKYALSVSQLALKAADATRQLKRVTELPSPSQIQMQQQAAERATSQLQDALIELANKQDLLKDVERDLARDSDAALSLIESVAAPMRDSIATALEAMNAMADSRPNDQPSASEQGQPELAKKLSEAIQRESATIDAITKVANHFAMLEQQSQNTDSAREKELAQSREDLSLLATEAANEPSLPPDAIPLRDTTEDYERAEELASLAKSDPLELLQKLEQELKTNPLMQDELSDISKANAQAVALELRNAAKDELSMAIQNENSDLVLAGEKRLQIEKLRSVSEQAERFAARLLTKASTIATRAGNSAEAIALEQSSRELGIAANSVKRLNEQSTRLEFEQSLQPLSEKLAQAQRQIQVTSQAIEPKIENRTAKDEQTRQALRNEMRNLQNQIREEMNKQARDTSKESLQRFEQAKKRAEQLATPLKNARRQTQEAKRALEKAPDNDASKERLRNASIQEEQLVARTQTAQSEVRQAESTAEQAKLRASKFDESVRKDVDKPNPIAALAAEQLEKAREQLDELQSQVSSLIPETKSLSEPRSTSAALSAEKNQHKGIQEKVGDAAQELARSARHEERLGNTSGAKVLAETSAQVDKTSNESLQQVADKLDAAATDAIRSEADQATANQDSEIQEPFRRPATQALQDTVTQASQELTNLARQLDQAIGSKESSQQGTDIPKPNADSSGPNQGSQSKGSKQERDEKQRAARELARMLDELDRSTNADPSSNGKSARGENSSKSQGQQQASAEEQADRNGSRSSFQDSVRNSADNLSGAMNQDRLNQRSASNQTRNSSRNESSQSQSQANKQGRGMAGQEPGAFVLPGRSKEPSRDWGNLREQRAEDTIEGRRDEYDPEFVEAIKAYFKAMGSRL